MSKLLALLDLELLHLGLEDVALPVNQLVDDALVERLGPGVEAVVEGCRDLELFDVSQCKNLQRWIDAGGPASVKQRGRKVVFETVADGRWRTAQR